MMDAKYVKAFTLVTLWYLKMTSIPEENIILKAMSKPNFFQELKRRNVYKVAITYVVVAWLIMQVAAIVLPAIDAPDWVMRVLLFFLAIAFPIALILAWAFEMSPEGIISTTSLEAKENPYPDHKKKPLTSKVAIGVLLLVVAAQLLCNKYGSSNSNDLGISENAATLVTDKSKLSESLTPDQTVLEAEVEKSIAVRPFWNESADPENEYFVNGMTQDIASNLTKISDIKRVISRGSMEKYRTTNQSTKEIAQELDVRYLLEGTVQKLGNQVKIHAQLIYAEGEHAVWDNTYMLDISDVTVIFTLQTDIAKKIATELNAKISFDEEKRLDNVPTSDIRAYDYVLRGDQMLNEFEMTSDVKYLNLSLELYDKALDNDPDFIRAMLGKAQIFLRNENYDSVLFYIEKAQKIDPEYPAGYFLKGAYYQSQGQEVKAFNNFSKALKMEPNDWRVNFRLGDILIRQRNDVINGLPYIQKAYNLSTEYRDQMYLNIGRCYFHIGDFDKAEYYFSKALELNVGCIIIMSYGWLYHNKGEFKQALDFYDTICNSIDCNLLCYLQRFYTYLYLGNYELSLENYNKAVDSGRDPSQKIDLVTLACVYKGLGREAESNIILEETRIQLEEFQSPHSYFLLASIYALQNDKVKAIEYLLKYEEYGYTIWFNEITFYPAFKKLWKEPAFEAIVTRVENEKATLRKAIRQMEDSGEITF